MFKELVIYSINKVYSKQFLMFFTSSLVGAFAFSLRGQSRNEIFQEAAKLGSQGIKNIVKNI